MALDVYQAFVLVVEQGSVSAAARVLGVPRPTVSRRLARLEERLGERLIRRGARQVTVTRAGRQLYQKVRGPLDRLAAAAREILDQPDAPRGLLRVAIPPLLAEPLAPLLLDFQGRYSGVALEVLTETRFVELTAEGFDVALRAGVLRNPALVQRKLLTMHAGAYAAPSYLAARGTPRNVAELAPHSLLRGYGARNDPRRWWPLADGGRLPVGGTFLSNDRSLLRAACVAGHGIALLADVPRLDPSLVPVLPEVGARMALHVVYPERELLPPRSRVFIDAVVEFFARWER